MWDAGEGTRAKLGRAKIGARGGGGWSIFFPSLQFVRGQNAQKSFSTRTLVTQASDSKDIAKIVSSDSPILALSGSYLILCTDRLS